MSGILRTFLIDYPMCFRRSRNKTTVQEAPEILGKMEAALVWCQRATEELDKICEKHWIYLLIPHSKITPNLDFSGVKTKYRK